MDHSQQGNTIRNFGKICSVALDDIIPARNPLRPIVDTFLDVLWPSIVLNGLLVRLELYSDNSLKHGNHRFHCLKKYKETPEFSRIFPGGMIPVVLLEENPDSSEMIADAAEARMRQPLSSQDIRFIAQSLLESGYVNRAGRPKEGERLLLPALSQSMGMSIRTLQRILSPISTSEKTNRDFQKFQNAWGKCSASERLQFLQIPDKSRIRPLITLLRLIEDSEGEVRRDFIAWASERVGSPFLPDSGPDEAA